jgi:hypothetical protein
MRCFLMLVSLAAAALTAAGAHAQQSPATDLDALMARALARRDENWKKIEQYVLDEREVIDVRAPDDGLLFGDRREYTWFIRDGFFVRSPVRVNGVMIADGDRRTYERRWIERERRREQAAAARGDQRPDAAARDLAIAQDVGGLLRQSREPRFISAGYFLEFTFEPGNYYVAGRETLDGRSVLRVEYFPTNLFGNEERRKRRRPDPPSQRDREISAKMNRTAVVTLWVEPDTAEIRRYTFENLGLDFLPAAWLVRVTEARADVTMIEPFAGVLLPGTIQIRAALQFASGTYRAAYDLEYYGYKQARARSTIVPSR